MTAPIVDTDKEPGLERILAALRWLRTQGTSTKDQDHGQQTKEAG